MMNEPLSEHDVNQAAHRPPYHIQPPKPPRSAPIVRPRDEPPYEPRFDSLLAIPYDCVEPHQAVVTVRMPRATHAALVEEAHTLRTSLNSLLLSKVTAAIDRCEILPTGAKARRKRADFVDKNSTDGP